MRTTHCYEEARGAIGAVKSAREELQPCVIAVHEHFPRLLGFHLGKPRVLSSESRGRICFVQVQDDVQERRD